MRVVYADSLVLDGKDYSDICFQYNSETYDRDQLHSTSLLNKKGKGEGYLNKNGNKMNNTYRELVSCIIEFRDSRKNLKNTSEAVRYIA